MALSTRPKLGKLKLYSSRQKQRRHASPRQIVALRLNDFAILFRSRYGIALPDDDAGRDDLEPVIHHLASMPQASKRIGFWLEIWAPWLTLTEQRSIISDGIANARAWSADQLAWRYRVTAAERTGLGLTTIGAIDQGKAARTKARKQRARHRMAKARHNAGSLPRQQYEQASKSQRRPWLEQGISRRTWYRRQRGTGPCAP